MSREIGTANINVSTGTGGLWQIFSYSLFNFSVSRLSVCTRSRWSGFRPNGCEGLTLRVIRELIDRVYSSSDLPVVLRHRRNRRTWTAKYFGKHPDKAAGSRHRLKLRVISRRDLDGAPSNRSGTGIPTDEKLERISSFSPFPLFFSRAAPKSSLVDSIRGESHLLPLTRPAKRNLLNRR